MIKVLDNSVPWWGLPFWLADGCLLVVSSHGKERESKLSGISPSKGTNPIMMAPLSWPPLNLITVQRPHFQISLPWGLGLDLWIWEGGTIQSIAPAMVVPNTHVVGLIVSPNRYIQLLTPGTCECDLFGNRIFTDVIKLKWSHSRSRWSLTPSDEWLYKKRETGIQTQTGREYHVSMEAEIGELSVLLDHGRFTPEPFSLIPTDK